MDYGRFINRLPAGTDPKLAQAIADIARDLLRESEPFEKKLGNYVDIAADYGAVGDGATDDQPKFVQAITDLKAGGGGVLFVPNRAYYFGAAWSLSEAHGITVIGGGARYDPNATLTGRPRLIFGTSGGGISVSNSRGLNLKNIYVDGTSTATVGIELDRLLHSVWENVYADNVTTGWRFTNDSSNVDEANMWNTFINCGCSASGTGFIFTNEGVAGGSWHNTFINSVIAHGSGGPGIDLYYCDNLTFIQTFIYRDAGTAYGVVWNGGAGTQPPNSIYFYHLQSGGGGISIESGVTDAGAVYGYDMSNGQPYPTIPDDCRFSITTDGLNSPGWQANRHLATRGVSDWRSDTNDGWSFRDDGSYGIRYWRNTDAASWRMRLNTSDRFGEMRYSFDGSADAESFKWNSDGLKLAAGKTVDFTDTASTVGAAGGASALPATPSGYITIKVQGTNYKVPYYAT